MVRNNKNRNKELRLTVSKSLITDELRFVRWSYRVNPILKGFIKDTKYLLNEIKLDPEQ